MGAYSIFENHHQPGFFVGSEKFNGKTLDELKKQRISLLARILDRLDQEEIDLKNAKKKIPRELCEKIRIVSNELRVEQRPSKPGNENDKPSEADSVLNRTDKSRRLRLRFPKRA